MQSMACMYSQYSDAAADRTITPMISGIRIGDNGYYGYHHQSMQGGGPSPLNSTVSLGGGVSGGGVVYQRDLDLKMEPYDQMSGSLYRQRSSLVEPPMDSSPSSQSSSGSSCGGGPNGALNGRNRKVKEDKICGVCGDKALGFNFDAISCESCKAFFRRNAPKGLAYFKCPYDEKCKMDLSNRRFCKRCRLKKCFEIGMRKEYILTDDEKAQKRQKIEENRYIKKLCASAATGPAPGSTAAVPAALQVTGKSAVVNESCGSGSGAEDLESADDSRSSDKSMTPQAPQTSSSSSSELSPVQTLTLQPSTIILNPAMSLTPDDTSAIYDLHVAYRNSLEVSIDKHVSRDHANFSDIVNIAELSVRRVIAMAKQVPAFKALPQVEQIHLLKGGSIELLILRSVIAFDKEKQHFLDPLDQEDTTAMKLEQLQHAENGLGLFEDHMKFIRSLALDLHADETTLILLLVISLFSPDRENLEYRDLVAAEQERYSMLLKNYLESTHGMAAARCMFPRLLIKLTDIRNLNEEHSQVLLKVNPEGIQPLMKEVLDLTC